MSLPRSILAMFVAAFNSGIGGGWALCVVIAAIFVLISGGASCAFLLLLVDIGRSLGAMRPKPQKVRRRDDE
jgi:hypothetical protein